MQIRFHPLRPGEYPNTAIRRRSDQFASPWHKTLGLLERELGHLGAHDIVIQIAVTGEEIRVDGWPRANARPSHPGVIISFDSKHGPLRYLTDQFYDWQANIRAIALGLEALRAVDRYGITRRGEQYTGWKALTTGNGPTTRMQAARIIATWGKVDPEIVLSDTEIRRAAIAQALRLTHPDQGGKTEDFDLVQRARRILAET